MVISHFKNISFFFLGRFVEEHDINFDIQLISPIIHLLEHFIKSILNDVRLEDKTYKSISAEHLLKIVNWRSSKSQQPGKCDQSQQVEERS